MAVESVSASSSASNVSVRQTSQEERGARRAELEEHRVDNLRPSEPPKQAQAPTINTSGQTVGTRIDVTV